jgi:uncharacterized protein
MVLFVTGVCNRSCWYCPLSSERRNQDVIFANDREIHDLSDILAEAELMSALGTGITGGEPLLVLDRVIECCSLLKERFGREHQIHLYTGIAPSRETLQQMAGLVDEIRFHPPEELWSCILDTSYANAARQAKELGFDVGIEIPSLKGSEHLIPALPLLDFLNINELEWGETSAEEMRCRGLTLSDGLHNAVKQSQRWAIPLRRQKKVHWCTSAFKDAVQLRERLKRIARNTARPFDEVTADGTVIYGVIEDQGVSPETIPFLSKDNYEYTDDHIEVNWRLLKRHARKIPGNKYIVERYPNGGIVVEVTPI